MDSQTREYLKREMSDQRMKKSRLEGRIEREIRENKFKKPVVRFPKIEQMIPDHLIPEEFKEKVRRLIREAQEQVS